MVRSGNSGKNREPDPRSFQILFGQLVRRYREKTGLSQMDVARLVYNDETKASRVSDVERGRHEPQAGTVADYREALRIPAAEIEALRYPPKPDLPPGFAEELGLADALLENLAWRFGHDNPNAGRAALREYLQDKAIEYQALKTRLDKLAATEVRISNQLSAASGELEAGNFGAADHILANAEELQQTEHTLVQVRKQAEIRAARADAALLKGDAEAAHEHFATAAAFYDPFDLQEGAAQRRKYFVRLYQHAMRYGGAGLTHAIALAERNLEVYVDTNDQLGWVKTQNNLGTALQLRGERTKGAEGARLLARAVETYEAALPPQCGPH